MDKMMQIGQIVMGRYEIQDIIGEGGEGAVGKAVDYQTSNIVAVKEIRIPLKKPDRKKALARFQRAAQICIGHPNVVDPIDYGEENDCWYIVFPYVDGLNLEICLERNGGKLPPDYVVALIVPIAEALSIAHAQGFVHRDLKPANIVVAPGGKPHLVDFGICKDISQQTVTGADDTLGTWECMSPEQARDARSVDHRADLYSLGIILYWTIIGSPPLKGTTPASIITEILHETPVRPRLLDPSIPEYLDRICMRLLEKNPDARFQTADELIQALRGAGTQSAQRQFCSSCGAPLQGGSRFCQICGAGLVTTSGAERCMACGAEVASDPTCSGCTRPFSHVDHRISFTAGALTGLTYRIPEGIYIVGRDELAQRDSTISRQHIAVACLNGTLFFQDAGSVNKTYVGIKPADTTIQLVTGQEVAIAGNIGIYTTN